MKIYEDLARLRVEEAIQQGLASQRIWRAKRAGTATDSVAMEILSQGASSQPWAADMGLWASFKRLLAGAWARATEALSSTTEAGVGKG